ncbi:MAG TPA: DUF4124 domain-containing protein [Steroidobacteraceae bacterium]|nr:DUF4124 domain-containing protein [Steroidobacteraceae bacterium]
MKRVLLCTVLMTWSALAFAVVYKWVDAEGKVQYGDRPPDGVHAEVVELLGTHTSRNTNPAPTARATAPSDQATRDAKKAVDSDVAQTRDKQCAEAQERYKKLIEGRRLYKTGDNGERQYLTSEEIDSERLNAKRDIDAICNSAT